MRYFLENITGKRIYNPDFFHGESTIEQNPITFEFNRTKEPVVERRVVEVFKDSAGRITGKTVADVVVEPEEGYWQVFDTRKGSKENITNTQDWDFSACQDTNLIYDGFESVGIYHVFTEQEQEEFDRHIQKEQEEKEIKEFNEQQLKELPEFENDTDTAICDLYEMVEPVLKKSNKKSNGHTAIAKAYARRILRGEITLDDVPESIRDEVRRILEEN